MIANSAVLAAIVLLLLTFELLEELAFLAPYKRVIFHDYLWMIIGSLVVVFVNLFACFYVITRHLFLKDTGRKLAHVEKQLLTPETIVRDLSERLSQDE
jgi:formate-dependent nitrite reductase membrane component NrfD